MDKNQHIIKDPVYGTMSISAEEHQFIKPFLDHPLFQRLRHIKQLSFVDLIFPGAVHTRFNHSVGCSYLCSRIYKQLYPKETGLNHDHKLIILAGLLHDIGHGPFSHAFEEVKIFKDYKIKHEDWFKYFITEIFKSPQIRNQENLCEDLCTLFSKEYFGSAWFKTVLSSQIDADRMDYILRDSLFCGVKYGQYDLDWLLSCLMLGKNKELLITEKGIGSAEQFLHARNLLHKNVYYNVKSTAISYCVIDFLNTLVNEKDEIKDIISENKLIEFIDAIKFVSDSVSNSESDPEAKKQRIMEKTYDQYKILVDFDVWLAIREIANHSGDSTCHKLARRIYNRKLPIACRIQPSSIKFVEELVTDYRKKENWGEWEIRVIKKTVCFYQESNDPVYISDKHGVKRTLQDSSTTISNIGNQNDSVFFLYIDHNLYNDNSIKNMIKTCNKHAVFIDE